MATSIQVSRRLQQQLQKRKLTGKETYEEIIWGLLEDTAEMHTAVKKAMIRARRDVKQQNLRAFFSLQRELRV